MNKLPISAIIMTKNEERNLPQCLESIASYVDDIIIVDSFSDDATLNIAQKYTSKIYQNKWINYATQYNWAINNADLKHEWILRIDADERWTPKGFEELAKIIEEDKYDGVYIKLQIYFMGKFIRWGGFYPMRFLRVYKKSKGQMENRWMDEHIMVDGPVIISNIDAIEANYDRMENIALWTTKHNGYSTREAMEYLIAKNRIRSMDTIARFWGTKTERKRWLKEKVYFRIPLFVRPFFYFVFRYFIKLGFLDGKRGFIFCTLQAFWYRFLVDTKIFQITSLAKQEHKTIPEVIKEHYGYEI